MTHRPTRSTITLGILAGGRATRLGGVDKAWLQRGTTPQVLRWRDRFAHEVSHVLVSANRQLARYREAGLVTVEDHGSAGGAGPIAGLAALATACRTPWLLTIPVDLLDIEACLLPRLIGGRGSDGACARDGDGAQPLVALWRVAALAPAAENSLSTGDFAVHALQRQLDMQVVHFSHVRFGNLNMPEDLVVAGIDPIQRRL